MRTEVMKIEVKNVHVLHGRRNDDRQCPIALAMQDYGLEGASATRESLEWYHTKGVYIGTEPPYEVKDFIEDYDNGRDVHPFVFDLEWERYDDVE